VVGGSSDDRWRRVGDDAGGVHPPELEELSLQGEVLLLLIERVPTGVELGLFGLLCLVNVVESVLLKGKLGSGKALLAGHEAGGECHVLESCSFHCSGSGSVCIGAGGGEWGGAVEDKQSSRCAHNAGVELR
jgi:hypothetical protein